MDAHATLDIYFVLRMNARACFVLILGLNPGAVPRMGLCTVAPAPFGSCLLFLFAIYLWDVPNKAVKKIKSENNLIRVPGVICPGRFIFNVPYG